jgi:predicted alpha/beta hydrolase family esterase
MKNKKQVIFVPGFTGTDDGGWPDWLSREFTRAGFDFKLLSMPDIMCPEVHQWLEFLTEQKIKITDNTYFIGHSLGCITIARYLEKLPAKAMAQACVFVAGFCTIPKVPLLIDFCSLPLDYSLVRNHAKDFFVISSDNDHIIPTSSSEEFAEKLGAEMIIEHAKGHFTSEVKELHSALNIILEIDQMKEEEREMKKLRSIL